MPGPWREVMHIEDCVGPHGGAYWMLSLAECGHLAPHSKPVFRAYHAFRPPLSAPRRKRCLSCHFKSQPKPETKR